MFKESVGDIGSDDTIVTVTCASTICIPINGTVCPAQKVCSILFKKFFLTKLIHFVDVSH